MVQQWETLKAASKKPWYLAGTRMEKGRCDTFEERGMVNWAIDLVFHLRSTLFTKLSHCILATKHSKGLKEGLHMDTTVVVKRGTNMS
jgi:hypothetical protein